MQENLIQKTEKHERGQSMVELAISLIVILYLLMGAVEFSIALFQYVTISDAAQEGAIYGSVNPLDTNGMKQRAVATASDILVLDPGNITVSLVGDGYCEGLSALGLGPPNSIKVEIKYSHQIFLPLVTPMIGTDKIRLTAVTTNTILQPPCG